VFRVVLFKPANLMLPFLVFFSVGSGFGPLNTVMNHQPNISGPTE
jgi:hypothetical protein